MNLIRSWASGVNLPYVYSILSRRLKQRARKSQQNQMPKSQQSKAPASNGGLQMITTALLRTRPLPQPDPNGDKNDRGSVLVIGGSREVPGALILAGTAALRAGAGRLRLATSRSVAPLVATAMLEARVIGVPDS